MARYRWENVHQWFDDYIDRKSKQNPRFALQLFKQLAQQMSEDEIQDLFQPEMELDGYFDDLDTEECSACGEKVPTSYIADPDEHVTIDRERLCGTCHREWLDYDEVPCPGCPVEGKSYADAHGQDDEGRSEAHDRPHEG